MAKARSSSDTQTAVVHGEARVRPRERPGGLLLVEEGHAHEEPEHGTAKRFGQPRGVVHRPRDERPVGPEAAVGHEEVQVRMPVGARAMGLQTRDDADRTLPLAGQRAVASVTMRAATRAISPSRRRRHR